MSNADSEQYSRSRALANKVTFEALKVLKDHGGQLPSSQVIEEVGKRVELDEWARSRYEKSGYVRWQSILHFYSIDCCKAGFLVKKRGVWYLTPDGEEALLLGPNELMEKAGKAYRAWRAENPVEPKDEPEGETPEDTRRSAELKADEIEAIATEGLKDFIASKNPYEFQDLAAALLRGMGYYTPFVAPRGKDGGLDILAYQDPLGTATPRIKVQIKHRGQSTSVQQIRELMGILQKEGDVGMFVSTGGFTTDAKAAARSSHVHVELVDADRFIELWQTFYPKLNDEDRSLMPLIPIYFLAPSS